MILSEVAPEFHGHCLRGGAGVGPVSSEHVSVARAHHPARVTCLPHEPWGGDAIQGRVEVCQHEDARLGDPGQLGFLLCLACRPGQCRRYSRVIGRRA